MPESGETPHAQTPDAAAPQWRDRIAAARAQADAAERPPRRTPADSEASDIDPVTVPGYRLVRRISRGGQGAVYEALRTATQRRVAIKLLKLDGQERSPDRVRFDREVAILRTLRDPRIVAIHEHGVIGSRAYFVMDYIEGAPLDEYLARQPRSLRRMVELTAEICEAVESAHRAGIAHRDVKPANVLIDEEGRPCVLDFGLAKTGVTAPRDARDANSSEATRMGEFVGSLLWASPEQLAGDPAAIDIRTDVYSLGVVLYQTLTGQFPYAMSVGAAQAAHSIRSVEPIPPRELHGDVDAALEAIILRCLRKAPADRYADAGGLARDLRCWLADEPIDAPLHSSWSVRPRARSRSRMLRVTAAARRVAESLLGPTVIADLTEIDRRASPRRLATASLILLAAGELLAGILAIALVATAFSAQSLLQWVEHGFDLLILGAYIFFVPAALGLVLLRPMSQDVRVEPKRLPWRAALLAILAGALVAALVLWKGRQSLTDLLAMTFAVAPGAALLRVIGRLLRHEGQVKLARHAMFSLRALLAYGLCALAVLAMRSAERMVEDAPHVLHALTAIALLLGVGVGVSAMLLLAGLPRAMRRAGDSW